MAKLLNKKELAAVGVRALKGMSTSNPARVAICELLEHAEAMADHPVRFFESEVLRLTGRLAEVIKERDDIKASIERLGRVEVISDRVVDEHS